MSGTPTSEAIVGTWTVTAAGGVATPPGVDAHLTFGDDGRMHGRGGVNNLAGGYEVEGDGDQAVLVIGPVMSTLMAGPEPAMAHEYRMTSALDGRLPLRIHGDTVTIGPAATAIELVRAASPPA